MLFIFCKEPNLNTSHGRMVEPDDIKRENEEDDLIQKSKTNRIKILYYFILASEVLMIGLVFLLWDTMNAFDIFYAGPLSLVLKSLFVIGILTLAYFRFYKLFGTRWDYINPDVSWTVKGPLILAAVAGVFLYNWGILVFVKGACIANHNTDIAGFTFSNYGITTALTRSWYHDTCPNKQEPCFVYATLPEDALDQVFINFHLNPASCKGK